MKRITQVFLSSLAAAAMLGAAGLVQAGEPSAGAARLVQAGEPAAVEASSKAANQKKSRSGSKADDLPKPVKPVTRSRAAVKAEAIKANDEHRTTFSQSLDILKN